MNHDWTSFLENNGANFSANGETIFHGDRNSSCQKINLSHIGVLRISGEDKQTFLQGQLTNDTRNINAESSQLSSYCTPKGRMLANFRLLERDNDWYLLIPASRLEAVLKRLKMFILRSAVTIENVSDDFICTGLVGNCISETLDVNLPAAADEVTQHNGVTYVRVETQKPRYIALAEYDAMHALWQQLEQAVQVSTEQWRLDDIRAGIPNITEETIEAFIPQMTNLQLLNGVSFTKGCYTGQEVVARMQYLGKLKRRMYPVSFESVAEPAPGDEVFSSNSQSGQGAGKLVDVVQVADNRYEALAVLEINSIDDGSFQLNDSDGPVLNIGQPPYQFETEEK